MLGWTSALTRSSCQPPYGKIYLVQYSLYLQPPCRFYPVLNLLPANGEMVAKAKDDLKRALLVLNSHLQDNTFLVGHRVTLADITVASSLVYPFKFVMEAGYRADIGNVERWFMTCVNQPCFRAVVGEVVLCETELVPSGGLPTPPTSNGENKQQQQQQQQGGKKGKKKNKKNKKEGDEKSEEPPKPKKVKHPLKIMDEETPSPFIGDVWKKIYSNCTSYDTAMGQFWDMFDAEGWSLWICRYNYDVENTVLFMTSNLVSGFVQRTGEIRKWAFGVMQVTSQEAPHKVSGVWLMRGQSIQPLLDANDDAAYYTWTKIEAPLSDDDKAVVKAFWCNEEELEGLPIVDCKVFK